MEERKVAWTLATGFIQPHKRCCCCNDEILNGKWIQAIYWSKANLPVVIEVFCSEECISTQEMMMSFYTWPEEKQEIQRYLDAGQLSFFVIHKFLANTIFFGGACFYDYQSKRWLMHMFFPTLSNPVVTQEGSGENSIPELPKEYIIREIYTSTILATIPEHYREMFSAKIKEEQQPS